MILRKFLLILMLIILSFTLVINIMGPTLIIFAFYFFVILSMILIYVEIIRNKKSEEPQGKESKRQ